MIDVVLRKEVFLAITRRREMTGMWAVQRAAPGSQRVSTAGRQLPRERPRKPGKRTRVSTGATHKRTDQRSARHQIGAARTKIADMPLPLTPMDAQMARISG